MLYVRECWLFSTHAIRNKTTVRPSRRMFIDSRAEARERGYRGGPPNYQRSLRPVPATLLRIMGSRSLFERERCQLCYENPVEPCYRGWHEICPACELRGRRPLVTALLNQNLRREPTEYMIVTIAELCSIYSTHRKRLLFLRYTLLSRHSCFRVFTYFSGGIRGSVSSTEDVLDKIMSFL